MIDQWFYERSQWKPAWTLIPRRCDISGKWLLGKHMCGTLVITGPGDPVVVKVWNHRHEHTMLRLKGIKK